MYIARVRNRNSPPAMLLRESYREHGKVKTRTLANLTKLPPEAIELLRASLKGESLVPASETFEIIASPHHGHVQAVLCALRRLGFAELIASRPSVRRDRVVAMVAARVLAPHSKLATTRWWHVTTLPEVLGVVEADEDDLYEAVDWLLERQGRIEQKLAARHLENDALALYGLSSSYVEGVTCPLAEFGHDRDRKQGKRRVNYGLLTNAPTRTRLVKRLVIPSPRQNVQKRRYAKCTHTLSMTGLGRTASALCSRTSAESFATPAACQMHRRIRPPSRS